MEHSMLDIQAKLVDPLRDHMLQRLPLAGLVQLRASCRAFSVMIDTGA